MMSKRSYLLALLFSLYAASVAAMGMEYLDQRNYTSATALDLLGQTMLAEQGLLKPGSFVRIYPPLTDSFVLVASTLGNGIGKQLIVAATVLLVGMISAFWVGSLMRAGFGRWSSIACTVLLLANPMFLRAAADAPSWLALLLGIWVFARGMIRLPNSSGVNDFIRISCGLAIAVLAHPLGLIFALASLPFLGLAIPKSQLGGTASGWLMTIMFPAIISLLAIGYVTWVFSGSLSDIWESFRHSVLVERAISRNPSVQAQQLLLGLVALLSAAPLAIIAWLLRRRNSFDMTGVAALACVGLATVLLANFLDFWPGPTLAGVIALPLSAAVAKHAAPGLKPVFVMILFAFNLLVGAAILRFDKSPETTRFDAVLAGRPFNPANEELRGLGLALKGAKSIMFDAEIAPIAVAERGSAVGIISAASDEFKLALLQHQILGNAVVVENPKSDQGGDAISRIYPDIYAKGMIGFERIFDGPNWRAYAVKAE